MLTSMLLVLLMHWSQSLYREKKRTASLVLRQLSCEWLPIEVRASFFDASSFAGLCGRSPKAPHSPCGHCDRFAKLHLSGRERQPPERHRAGGQLVGGADVRRCGRVAPAHCLQVVALGRCPSEVGGVDVELSGHAIAGRQGPEAAG